MHIVIPAAAATGPLHQLRLTSRRVLGAWIGVLSLALHDPARAAEPPALPAPPPTLGCAAFVNEVLNSNTSAEAARQGWRAALARVEQAGSLDNPMLELGIAPLSVGADAPFGFEARASQKLPWFGKRALDKAASAAEAQAAQSDYESVRRELALSAVLLYQQYFIAAKALQLNAAHLELLRSLRDAAAAQLASGRSSSRDVLRAEADLAHLDHQALTLGAQRDITVAQMNELLHRPPEQPLLPPPDELPAPPEPEATAAQLAGRALRSRPELIALAQRARAQQIRAERAERELYPDLTVSTSYNSMWDMPAHRWMVGVSLDLPLQSSARDGAAGEARALRSQLEREAERSRDATRTQIYVALKQVEAAQHVLRLFETRLLPLARQRVETERAGFSTGRAPLTDVLDAERSLLELELEYQQARAERAVRRAELDRALGRIPGADWKEQAP
jgi:cobalt-zinc-cadmium efflux system outer membrane protein